MGASIIGGALRSFADARIIAIDPDLDRARTLLKGDTRIALFPDATALADVTPDLVVQGVKPQVFESVLATLPATILRAPIVSIMAGIPLDRVVRTLGHASVARVMPNLPALVGKGMSLGCKALDALDTGTAALVENLFSAIGSFAWAETEDVLERASPVYACGPGFVFAMAEHMSRAAVASGLPPLLAEQLVRQTFFGAAEMLANDGRSAEELKRAVTSPNGTTQAGLGVLEKSEAFPALISATLNAAYRRALEIGAAAPSHHVLSKI